MLEMRLVLCMLSFVIVTCATPAVLSEERVMAILEKLRRAQAVGELAVNTPTGIYPIKDINRNNFREVFNFKPLDRKHLEADFTKEKQADGEDDNKKQFSATDNSSSKKHHDAEKKQLRKPSKESDDEITTDLIDALQAVTNATERIDGTESHNVTILTTESIDISNSPNETEKESEPSELTTQRNVKLTVTDTDNQLEEADKKSADQSSTISQASDEITLLTQPSDKLLKPEIQNDIEGSGEMLEDVKEGSGTIDESPTTTLEPTALLTGQENTKTIVAASADEPSLLVSKLDDSRGRRTSPNPKLPSINLPQFPGVPYIFLPVKSIHGTKLPGLSYLLVPKKYENNLPDIFLTVNKV